MRYLSFLFFLLTANILFSQINNPLVESEERLTQLSNTFITDKVKENRLKAFSDFKTEIKTALNQSKSFKFPFSKMQAVSILYPQDSSFRIFTWQLFVDDNRYDYGGLIQMNNKENKIFELEDHSADIAPYDLEFEKLTADNWYGAVYFNLHQFDSQEGKRYVLFGFDGHQFYTKRKLAEVLYFDETGQPQFGAPIFTKKDGEVVSTKNRLFLEYYASSNVRLNYDPDLDLIIFDHLIPMRGPKETGGSVLVSDGSYHAYQLKTGVWQYIDNVFTQVSEVPPSPAPILDERDKNEDIFGKAKKKKKG